MKKEQTRFKETEIGMIAEDWEVEKIETLYEISSGLSKPRNEFGFGYPFLSFKDIFDNFSLPKELHELVNSSEKERKTCSVMRGDVFLTRTSETIEELGMSSVALKDYENATFNGFAKRLRPKIKDKLLPEFAVYLFRSDKIRSQILAFSSLTTRASLNASMIKEIKIFIPPLPEQTSIANILSSLDSKIGLNRQMNTTLEKIGQTIFKHWFVDFEFPNEKGKPYRSSGGKMVDSELGEIPKGWEVKAFSEIIAVNPGRPLTRGSVAKKVGMADLERWQSWISSWSKEPYTGGQKFKNDDTLMARITPCLDQGKTAFVSCLDDNEVAFGSTEFIILAPKVIKSPAYIFFLARSANVRDEAIMSMSGTSGRQRVPNEFFDRNLIVCPPMYLIEKFEDLVRPMMLIIKKNAFEMSSLGAMRDCLLPRLMSGRIRVSDPRARGNC